jgi:hypothetical protein
MKRVLLGSVLPVLTLGLAAAFVGPSLFEGPRGEPIRMAAAEPLPGIQLTNLEGDACASILALGDGGVSTASGIRIVALTLGSDGYRLSVDLREVPAGEAAVGATLVLLLDTSGRLLAAADASALAPDAARDALATDCDDHSGAVHGAI